MCKQELEAKENSMVDIYRAVFVNGRIKLMGPSQLPLIKQTNLLVLITRSTSIIPNVHVQSPTTYNSLTLPFSLLLPVPAYNLENVHFRFIINRLYAF